MGPTERMALLGSAVLATGCQLLDHADFTPEQQEQISQAASTAVKDAAGTLPAPWDLIAAIGGSTLLSVLGINKHRNATRKRDLRDRATRSEVAEIAMTTRSAEATMRGLGGAENPA